MGNVVKCPFYIYLEMMLKLFPLTCSQNQLGNWEKLLDLADVGDVQRDSNPSKCKNFVRKKFLQKIKLFLRKFLHEPILLRWAGQSRTGTVDRGEGPSEQFSHDSNSKIHFHFLCHGKSVCDLLIFPTRFAFEDFFVVLLLLFDGMTEGDLVGPSFAFRICGCRGGSTLGKGK